MSLCLNKPIFLKYNNINDCFISICSKFNKYNIIFLEEEIKMYISRCYNFFLNGGNTEIWNYYLENINKQNNMNIFEMDFKKPNHNSDSIYVHLGIGIGLGHSQGTQNIEEILLKYFEKEILNNKDYMITLCNKNDTIGKPNLFLSKYLGNTSINNIRYIYQSLHILNHIKYLQLNNVNVIEIGGGYGGLSFYIRNLSYIYNISINSYTIYDLEDVSKFQIRNQTELNNNIITKNLPDNINLKNQSFLISIYALSELIPSLIDDYNNLVLPFIKNGYLIWNCIPFDIEYINKINFEKNQLINISVEDICQNDLIIKF